MTELRLRRNTGIFGLVATLISLTQLPLYFIYPGALPQWDILTRVMVSIIGSAILIVFLVGFRLVLRQESLEMEWASTIALVSGLMWLTFSSVAQSMEVGTAIVSKIPIDPTVDGVLAPGQFLLFGSIGRLMTTLFLSASGYAIFRGRVMPAWLGWLAWIIAVVNVAFVPAMFFGRGSVLQRSRVGHDGNGSMPRRMLDPHSEHPLDQNPHQGGGVTRYLDRDSSALITDVVSRR
jgi:hypothetical protein